MPSRDEDDGVQLSHFRQHSADVDVTCLGCVLHRVLPLEAVIERLVVRGYGDENTGIRAVARFISEPCTRCGGTRFETKPHFHSRPLTPDQLP